MSQAKAISEMQPSKLEDSTTNRVLTRRASRSLQSGSPASTRDLTRDTPSTSPEPPTRVATRSQSTESSSELADSRKRRRRGKPPGSSKKRADSNNSYSSNNNNKAPSRDESDRETRTSIQRISKEAKEAKKAQRETVVKQRLAELDGLEKAIKSGTYPAHLRLLKEIEAKRTKKAYAIQRRRDLAVDDVRNAFVAQRKLFYDQYYFDKLNLRRSMMQQVQQKINLLEQEFYSHRIKSLSKEDIEDDLLRARNSLCSPSPTEDCNPVYTSYHYQGEIQESTKVETNSNHHRSYKATLSPSAKSSPPMLPSISASAVPATSPIFNPLDSLADHQYHKQHYGPLSTMQTPSPREKLAVDEQRLQKQSLTLPPLTPWRFEHASRST